MEAASTQSRELTGERAQRIVAAMRASVAARGAAGSTFDHVAREAGVSRGLLHYYFGTKERLLVEVVRRDCDIRMEVLGRALGAARSAEEAIAALVSDFEALIREDPGFFAVLFELFSAARRTPDVAAEVADLFARTRVHVADLLRAKEAEGVLRLNADADAVAGVLFALADGVALRILSEPDHDIGPALRAGAECARALIADPP